MIIAKQITFLLTAVIFIGACEELVKDEESITSNPEELVGTWDRDSVVISMEATVNSDQVLYHFFEEGTGELTVSGDHTASLTYLWPLSYFESFDDQDNYRCNDDGNWYESLEQCEDNCATSCEFDSSANDDQLELLSSNLDMISFMRALFEGSDNAQTITVFGINPDSDGSGNDKEHAFVEVLEVPALSSLDQLEEFEPDSFRVAEYEMENPTYTYDSTNFSVSIAGITLYKVTRTDSTWDVDSSTTVTVSGDLALTNLTIPANDPTEIAFIFDPTEFEDDSDGPTQLTFNADGTFSGISQETREDASGNETTMTDTFSGTWTADSVDITVIQEITEDGSTYIDTMTLRYYVVGNNFTFILEESPCGDDATDEDGNPMSEDECLDEMESALLFDEGSLTAMTAKMRYYFQRSSSSRPFLPMFVQENKSHKVVNINRSAIKSWQQLLAR